MAPSQATERARAERMSVREWTPMYMREKATARERAMTAMVARRVVLPEIKRRWEARRRMVPATMVTPMVWPEGKL